MSQIINVLGCPLGVVSTEFSAVRQSATFRFTPRGDIPRAVEFMNARPEFGLGLCEHNGSQDVQETSPKWIMTILPALLSGGLLARRVRHAPRRRISRWPSA